jgi:hypothetical protein
LFKAHVECVILAAVMDEQSKTVLGPECDAVIDGYADRRVILRSRSS